MVDNYAAFFNCTPVGRASDYDGPDLNLFILVGSGRNFLSVACPTGMQLGFSFAPGFSKLFSIVGQLTESVESSFLIHQDVYHHVYDLFVCLR